MPINTSLTVGFSFCKNPPVSDVSVASGCNLDERTKKGPMFSFSLEQIQTQFGDRRGKIILG